MFNKKVLNVTCAIYVQSSELNLDLENGRADLNSATLIKNTCAALRDKRTKKWSVKILFCFSGVLCRLKIVPSRKLVALETFVKYDWSKGESIAYLTF